MPYVATTVTTKHNPLDPDFEEWVNNILDPNVVWAEYPETAGNSIAQIVSRGLQDEANDVVEGFVSREFTNNDENSVWTMVATYESEDAFRKLSEDDGDGYRNSNITCNTSSPIVTGNGTKFTKWCQIGTELTRGLVPDDKSTVVSIGTIASIESDTSLTLTSNANINLQNKKYSVDLENFRPSVFNFIKNLYNQTYVSSIETTFANV